MPVNDKRKPSPKQSRLEKPSSNVDPQLSGGFYSTRMPNFSGPLSIDRSFQTSSKIKQPSRNQPTTPNNTSSRALKSQARQSRMVSNLADISRFESHDESKTPPKTQKSRHTISVQDLYKADMEAYDVDDTPEFNSGAERSFYRPTKMNLFQEDSISERAVYSRNNTNANKIEIIFEDSLYEDSEQVDRRPSPPKKYPPSEPRRKPGEKVVVRSREEIMAVKLRGLRFTKFKDIILKGRTRLEYTAFFEEVKTTRNREVEFMPEELNFLSKTLGRNLRTEFLKEYLVRHTPRM